MHPERESNDALRLARKHESEIKELLWRIESLEQTRRDYVPVIDAIVNERQIEKAVKSALTKHNRVYLSTVQRAGAVSLFALTIADLVRGIFH